MNEGLYVDYDELEKTREEVINLLNQFNDNSVNFAMKLKELQNYWSGPDYDAMSQNVRSIMDKIVGAEGMVPKLMTDIAMELEQKTSEYKSIQNSNIGYWG